MGDISKNFDYSEFACPCGCKDIKVDKKLLDMLEIVRKKFGSPITITSGIRCRPYNDTVPGHADNSKHIYGLAADFKVERHSAAEVHKFCMEQFRCMGGVGKYDGRTHIDSRENEARW